MLQNMVLAHLAIAKKCNPGLSERFNLFVKEREHSQASESDNSGEGAKDLVSIVEFQVYFSLNCSEVSSPQSHYKSLCLNVPQPLIDLSLLCRPTTSF